MATLKLLKILTCGLGKWSAGKESDSQGILAKKRSNGKENEEKTLDPERVQQPSAHHVCPAPDNQPPETELALPPTDAVEQHASTSVFPRGPIVPPGNMSRPPSGMGTPHLKYKDLWDEAYTKLRSEDPDLFKEYTRCIVSIEDSQQPEVIYDIDQLESDKRELYLATLVEKRVQTIPKEEWRTATMVYKKTVKLVLFAKNFITQVASNEPHAALAWAGISMLLPLLLKPDQQHQAATDALAEVSDLILRYRVVEITFWKRDEHLQAPDSGTPSLELFADTQTKIVNLYSQIMKIQIRMACYLSHPSWRKYIKDVFTLDDWQEMQIKIRDSDNNIKENLRIIGDVHLDSALNAQSARLQQLIKDTTPILKSIQSDVTHFIVSQDQKDILHHLAPEGEAVDTKEGFKHGHWKPSSGEWMKMSGEYQTWWVTKGGLLWCSGVAGAGKTVLASIMCEDLNARYAGDPDIEVIKMFFDYHYKRTRDQCLASLWKQLARRRPFNDEEITTLKRMYVEPRTRPGETKWKEMLAAEVHRYSRVFLIADALDESKVEYPLQFVRELLGLLPTANIMITTRPEFRVRDLHIASEVSIIEVKAHEKDLLEFVKTRIDREDKLRQAIEMKPELENRIKNEVPRNAQGMFLLAELLMADLAECSKPAKVQEKLDKPPENLNQAYDASFSRIESNYGREVLYILCIAKTPITFAQMRCILSLEKDSKSLNPGDYVVEKMVVGSSAGLVDLDQETKVVRFGHETTRTYLQDFHSAEIKKAHLDLLRKCLVYLRFPSMRLEYWSENRQIKRHVKENPFLEYAAVYWGDHAREVGINDYEDLVEDIMDLISKPENLARAIRVLLWKTTKGLIEKHQWGGWGAEQKTKGKMRPINIVAYCGLDDILARLLQDNPESYLDSGDPFGNVVHWAARGNHECILNRLMKQRQIKEIINQFSELAHTPLHVALVFQRTRALEILLQNGADPSIKIHREPDWHSLQLAIWHGPPKHVEILLDTNKTEQLLWTRDILGRLALNIAADTDDTQSISVLLPLYAKAIEGNSHGIEELRDDMSRNILHQAAQGGHPRTTEVILQHSLGRDLARNGNYRGHTPFETAAFCGRIHVVKSYYDRVDREWLMKQVRAPWLAADRGHSETLHELLTFFDCIPDAQDLYREILIVAVDNGRIESTKDITSMITFTANDDILSQALFLAARRGHVEVISHVLKIGTPVDSQDLQGYTALHWAVSEGMAAGVRVLLESHCMLEIKDRRGRTPLMIALERRYPAISILLFQYGALRPDIDDECHLWLRTQSWWSRFENLQRDNPILYAVQRDARPRREVMILDRKGALSPASSTEVFRAALCLHKALGSQPRNLPLVNWILELAEYWISTESQRGGEHWYDENDPKPVYLRSLPIVGRESRPVQRITFQVSSHDQSEGSGPGDFGGYTWVCIEREQAADLRSDRIRILKNKHNRGDWTQFNISWPDRDGFDRTPETPGEGDKEEWLARLGQGDRVLVVPQVVLQNWRNFLNRAEMMVYTTCLRQTAYRRVSPKTGRLRAIDFASS